MRRAFLAVLALCNSGCTIGWGSAFVGEWRARKELEYRACLEDEQGRCIKTHEKTKTIPARSFMGVAHSLPATMGASWVTYQGDTQPKFRAESVLEVLRGRGPWAYSVRFGAAFDVDKLVAVMVPVTIQGHYALTEKFNLYAGGGWVPFSVRDDERSIIGARGLVGLRWAFANTYQQNFFVLGVEGNTTWVYFDESYLSTGAVGYLGGFF
jgi:hypothetical protein